MAEVASYQRVVKLFGFEDLQPDLLGKTVIMAGRGLGLENRIL